MRPKRCIILQHCMILQHSKKMGEAGLQLFTATQTRPRRVENTELSSSVGGGQISLTSVLIGGFDHVLLCLFTKPAPLICSGPE
jgi:hypothetical protein